MKRAPAYTQVILAIVSMTACGRPHVELKPPRSFSPTVRRRAYAELRPHAVTQPTAVLVDEFDQVVSVKKRRRILELENGRTVIYPEDLLPLIPPESVAAIAAGEAAAARSQGRWLTALATSSGVLGVAAFFGPMFTRRTTPFVIGGLSAIMVTIVLGVLASFRFDEEDEQAGTAFEAYDDALRDQLRLCGDEALPCEDVARATSTR